MPLMTVSKKSGSSLACKSTIIAGTFLLLTACTASSTPDLANSFSENSLSYSAPEPSTQITALPVLEPASALDPATTASTQYAALASDGITPLRGSDGTVMTEGILEQTPESLAEQRIAELYPRIKHGKCPGGWGSQAKKPDAIRVTPGHPYYIEIRMRHTPPLPIGHTYTAYGRLDLEGNKLDEHLTMLAPIGGYAGAAMAGAVPMPASTNPSAIDCRITPVAAYRVSLTASQYEKLLLAVKKAKQEKPRYHLFANNCNHYTSRISQSVGIKSPRNKYTSSLVYMYDIIKENEARQMARGG